jgi:hypothetical protein
MDDGLFVKHGESFKFNRVIVVTKAGDYCWWYVLVVKEVYYPYIRNVIY